MAMERRRWGEWRGGGGEGEGGGGELMGPSPPSRRAEDVPDRRPVHEGAAGGGKRPASLRPTSPQRQRRQEGR